MDATTKFFLLCAYPDLALDDKWITVKPNGPDAKGAHMLIGEGGEVKAGAGGKFNGVRLNAVKRVAQAEKNNRIAQRQLKNNPDNKSFQRSARQAEAQLKEAKNSGRTESARQSESERIQGQKQEIREKWKRQGTMFPGKAESGQTQNLNKPSKNTEQKTSKQTINSSEKITKALISGGFNAGKASELVKKNIEYLDRVYGKLSAKKAAEVLRSIQ